MTPEYITREEHEEFCKRMEEEHARINCRMTTVEKATLQLNTMALSIEKLALNMEFMVKEQQAQGKRLEKLEAVPQKNWEKFKFAIIGAVGTAIGAGIYAMMANFII
jgi:uncharacterized membrane protein YukC